MDLFSRKSYLAGLMLVAAVLLCALVLRQFQKPDLTVYEGTYPGIREIIEPEYTFENHRVVLRLGIASDAASAARQLVVFVYDTAGSQFGMLKDVRNGTITVTEADFPEYEARFRGTRVEGYKVFKRVNGRGEGDSFVRRLQTAREQKLRFGVQQCLYPVCTRCLDVCPVIAKGVIEMHQAKGGQILPKVLFGACPRSGKCFTVCTLGAFYKADMRHVQRHPEGTVKLETELHPKVLP